MSKSYYLFCYDITDDKKRLRVMKFLKEKGYDLQKSVFIVVCQQAEDALRIYNAVLKMIDDGDNIFMTPLCQSCIKKILTSNKQSCFDSVWIV